MKFLLTFSPFILFFTLSNSTRFFFDTRALEVLIRTRQRTQQQLSRNSRSASHRRGAISCTYYLKPCSFGAQLWLASKPIQWMAQRSITSCVMKIKTELLFSPLFLSPYSPVIRFQSNRWLENRANLRHFKLIMFQFCPWLAMKSRICAVACWEKMDRHLICHSAACEDRWRDIVHSPLHFCTA